MANKNNQQEPKKRKPANSRIKNAERKKLALEGKEILFGNKIDKKQKLLSDLPTSNTRLKITKEIMLKKSIAKLTNGRETVRQQLKKVNDTLKGYNSITW